MTKIYSYVLRVDDGAAPNPFWGVCTLTICKPAIRRTAKIGDWIIGTGSKNSRLKDGNICDFADSVIYAMKVTDIKTLKEYDRYCNESLPRKIPRWNSKDWRLRVGDCIYNYSTSDNPTLREGVHGENNINTDMSGKNALISNVFYYFGAEARPLPFELRNLIKRNQGHKKIENVELINLFETWLSQFEMNRVYAAPQMSWLFTIQSTDENYNACPTRDFDDSEDEERIC